MSANDNPELENQIQDNDVSFHCKDSGFTIKTLLEHNKNGKIIYREDLNWSVTKQSKFIESVLCGITVSNIYVQWIDLDVIIIDGSQRLQSLFNYAENNLKLSSLENLTMLNGKDYNYLTEHRKRMFLRTFVEWKEVHEMTNWKERSRLYTFANYSR